MTTSIDKFFFIIKKHNISLEKYYVLLSVSNVLLDKTQLAKYTYDCVRGDSRGNFSVQEYTRTIEFLLQEGDLKTITKEDCLYDSERWTNDDNECCSEFTYKEGLIDFSWQGAQVWSQLQVELYAIEGHTRFEKQVLYKWKNKNILSIFTITLEFMNIQLNKIRTNPSSIFMYNEKITHIGKPYEIRNWWVTRFEQLPSGWRTDIKYEEKQ